MAILGWCRACGHRASDEAQTCPQCGQPSPCVHVELNGVYEGRVSEIIESGAFVKLSSGVRGFLHISQIAREERVRSVSDKLSLGDSVRVKVIDIESQGRIRLSMKAVSL